VTTQQVTGNLDDMAERSARWLRVSTNKAGDKQQDENEQIPAVEQWETGHGYDVRKEYKLPGASAFKPDDKLFKENWAEVLKDITNGVFTVLVIWKLDRIDRKEQARKMIEQVSEVGGRIEFVADSDLNDQASMASRIMLELKQSVAHQHSKDKQDNALRTLANHRANGAISSRPPFGYYVEGPKHGKYFVVNESLRPIVETIFAKCIAGDSLITIAKWMDAQGIPTARGGKWSNTALWKIINNPAYMGYITDDNGHTIGKCPVIIDAATHKAANEALRCRPKRGPVIAENRSLLSGILLCPKCRDDNHSPMHSPMHRISCKDGPVLADGSRAKAYFYRCAGRGPQRKGCGNMVRLTITDALVDQGMRENTLPIMKRVYVPGHNHDAEIADVDYRIFQLSPEGLTRAEYLAKQNELWDLKEALETMPFVPDRWDWVDTGETYAGKWAAADADGKRAMLETAKVYAAKNERGNVYVIIEAVDEHGLINMRVIGDPPGQSLMERARAKGLDRELERVKTYNSRLDAEALNAILSRFRVGSSPSHQPHPETRSTAYYQPR
jgi:DNA invertase Pin-like site-specific DNA recombinase